MPLYNNIKWPIVLTLAYVVLLALSFLPLILAPDQNLGGVGLIFLTLPWSFILLGVLPANQAIEMLLAMMSLGLAGLLNAAIIYRLASYICCRH